MKLVYIINLTLEIDRYMIYIKNIKLTNINKIICFDYFYNVA